MSWSLSDFGWAVTLPSINAVPQMAAMQIISSKPFHFTPAHCSTGDHISCTRYRETSAWAALSMAARPQRENIFAACDRERRSDALQQYYPRDHCSRRERSSTPAKAEHFLSAMKGLFRSAS